MTRLPYTTHCRYDEGDTIEVDAIPLDNDVYLGLSARSLYLTPKKARRLAKAIKKAAKRAEKAAQ